MTLNMQLIEGKTQSSGSFKGNKPSCFARGLNGRSVVNLLGSMKKQCTTRETSKPPGFLGTMLAKLTRPQGDGKKLGRSGRERRKKNKVDTHYSKLTVEDRLYLKSQIAIWFPFIAHRPTLSELEKALAEMGTRILRNVAAFQIMDLNPILTESKEQRRLFRKCHQSLSPKDIKILLSSSTLDKRCVDDCLGVLDHGEGKPSHLPFASAKLKRLHRKESSNSFLNAEKNWRHSLMSDHGVMCSELPKKEEKPDNEAHRFRLLQLYDRKNYNVPGWFYLLLEIGSIIDLELMSLEKLSDDTLGEVKELVGPPRRISLHMVPTGNSSFVKGHLFVSVIEQERVAPAEDDVAPEEDDCKNVSTNNKMSNMAETSKRRQLPLPKNELEQYVSLKRLGIKPSDTTDNAMKDFPEDSSSQDDFFPKERSLSFQHNWAHVLPKRGQVFDETKLKRKSRQKTRRREVPTVQTYAGSKHSESNNKVKSEQSKHEAVQHNGKEKSANPLPTPAETCNGSAVYKDAQKRKRLHEKIKKLLSAGGTRKYHKPAKSGAGGVCENDDWAKTILGDQTKTCANSSNKDVTEKCERNKPCVSRPIGVHYPEYLPNEVPRRNVKTKPKNAKNSIYNEMHLSDVSAQNNNNLIDGEKNIEIIAHTNSKKHTLPQGCKLQDGDNFLSRRKSKHCKGTVDSRKLNKSNSSLNEPRLYLTSDYLFDDLSSAWSVDNYCRQNKSQNSNTEYEDESQGHLSKRNFQIPNANTNTTKRNTSLTKKSFVRNGYGDSERSNDNGYLDTLPHSHKACRRLNAKDYLHKAKTENSSIRSFSDSQYSSRISNDALRGSVTNFVREQWRSCNDNSISSSSNDKSNFRNSFDSQSSGAESESSSIKARVNIKQVRYQNDPQHSYNTVGYQSTSRPTDKRSLWSSEKQRQQTPSKLSTSIEGHNPESPTDNEDLMTSMYTDFKKNIKVRLKSTVPLNESRHSKATAGQYANAETEFNGNNENLLTNAVSTSTSSLHKFNIASTANETSGHGNRTLSPTGRNQPTKQSWLTLRDLGSLLTYCSEILSTDEPLTEGTIEILKAVDETLSVYFIEDDTGRLSRDASQYEARHPLCEKEDLCFKHQDFLDRHASRRKTRPNKVRLTKWPKCVNLASQVTDECPNYIVSPTVSSHHLDETQNKLDSDHDDHQAARPTVESDAKNPMHQKLDEPGSWQMHRRKNEGTDRSQQGSKREVPPPPPHTYLNDSITAVLSPYDDWPNQMYQSNAPEQFVSMSVPPEAEQSAENETQNRQYFEQKLDHQTTNDQTHIKRRCAQNTMYESDNTGGSPSACCPETVGAFGQKRFLDSNCQRFPFNLQNSYRPCPSYPSMCCNKTASCSENPYAWNHSSPITSKNHYPTHCLDCLDRISCCGGLRKKSYRKPQFTVTHGCHRRDLSDFPSRLHSPTIPRTPIIPRRMFEIPGHGCCFPAASALRPCRQTIGDMTSEFERRFGSPEETVPMRKVSISENLSMYTDELAEPMCSLDQSPAIITYANLVPNLKKTRACVKQPGTDHRSKCCNESVDRKNIEYIKELLRACVARERRGDDAFNHCSNSEARIKTCKLSDDDRKLFESIKCKLDSKLLKSLLKPDDCSDSTPKINQTTQCDTRIETPSECMCHQKKPAVYQSRTERPCCSCCHEDLKTACEPTTTRMHSKGLQADMSWASGKSRETSSQTCKCFVDRSYRCSCLLPMDNGTCSDKPSCACEYVDVNDEVSICENERLLRIGCRVTPKTFTTAAGRCAELKHTRCAVIEDISSCTHQGRASAKKTDKRNKSLQTTIVCHLSPPCVRCTPCLRESSGSACKSHSEIYPKLSPERLSMLASTRGCREIDQDWLHRNFKRDIGKERPTCGGKTRDANSFYVKKWDCFSEGSPLTAYLTDCIEKSRKTYKTADCNAFVPTSRNRPHCAFTENVDKHNKYEKYPMKSAWLDCGEPKRKDFYKENQLDEPRTKISPDIDRPIVHIRYKSKKASGKSEITVDSIPCNEEQIASPVRNLALELKKHVQKIIQNSKELKQQALNAEKCPKIGGNARPESDAKTPTNSSPSDVVKFHSSRKDDGSWSYVMKVKSPVARKPEEVSETYASKNVNCGNNNFGDPDPKQKSFYGYKINVTLPEMCVNDDTDRMIHEVLPEILKIVLCAILKVNSSDTKKQRGGGIPPHGKQHECLHENVNSNACMDDTTSDTKDCHNPQKLWGIDRFPIPRPSGSITRIPSRRLPCRGIKKSETSAEYYSQPNSYSLGKSERHTGCLRSSINGRYRNKTEIYCSPHRCTASTIGHKNGRSQIENVCGSVRGRQLDMTPWAQTEIFPESRCGDPVLEKYTDLKEIHSKGEDKACLGCQKCYGQREVSNKGRTILIEDFSSLEQSSLKSNTRGFRRCTQKSNSSCKARNLRDKKRIRTSEKGVQSMSGHMGTDDNTSARFLASGRESRHKSTCTSYNAPQRNGVKCSQPCVIMECYDSTPDFTTNTATESHDGVTTIRPALDYRPRVGGGQTYTVKVKHARCDRSVTPTKKLGEGEAPCRGTSPYCLFLLDEGPSVSRRVQLSPKRSQLARSSNKVKSPTSNDTADSSHGIEDLPIDSGTSATLIQSMTKMDAVRDSAAANVNAKLGKRSVSDVNPSTKKSQWNLSQSGTGIMFRSKSKSTQTNNTNNQFVGEKDTGERPQAHCATAINKSLIDWWNGPKETDDEKNKHLTHTLAKDPESLLPTYRRSERYKLPIIMSNQRIVSTVLGGEISKDKYRGWVKCKDSSTMTDNLVTLEKSMGVRDTKIRKPIFVNPKLSEVQNDAPVELGQTTKMMNEVQKISSEMKTHLRPNSITTTSQYDQPWQNVFVGSAELTEATSQRVVLEGAFYKSRHPGDVPEGRMEMCSSFLPQSSTCLLPFRLVLLASGDEADSKTVSGTYLRRMVSTDRFLKWNINFGMPDGRLFQEMAC